jgi:acetyl-CoA C-acetyltransferase
MTDIVIASAVRTPIGAFNGGLGSLPAHKLGEVAIAEVLRRAQVEPRDVSEVILGQILAAGEGMNPARQAAIGAGIPYETTAYSVNQVCGSGLRSVALGFQAIRNGDSEIVVGRAGKHEPVAALHPSAQRRPDGRRATRRHDDQGRVVGRLQRLSHGQHGRECRRALADRPRAGRTRFAARSQAKAEAAQRSRPVQDEIVPVTVASRRGGTVVDTDEHPKHGTTADAVEAASGLRQERHGHRRQCFRHQ